MSKLFFRVTKSGVWVFPPGALNKTDGQDEIVRYSSVSEIPVGLKADTVILDISPSLLDMRIIHLPFRDMEKIRETLPFELQRFTLKRPEDIVFDAILLDENASNGGDVLVVYLDRGYYNEVMKSLNEKGYDPEIVTSTKIIMAVQEGNLEQLEALNLESDDITVLDINDGLITDKDKVFNLRQQMLPFTKEYRDLKRSKKTTSLLLLVFLVTVLLNVTYGYFEKRAKLVRLKTQMVQLYKNAFPQGDKPVNPLYQMRAKIKSMKEDLALARGIPLGVLSQINRKWPDGLKVDELRMDKSGLYLKGEADDVKVLEVFERESGAKVKETEKLVGNRYRFVMVKEGD